MEKSINFKLSPDTKIEIVQAFLMENIDEYVSSDEEPEFYLPRESPDSGKYWETKWGKWLNDPKLLEPHSKLSKLFQLRFRVPFILFKHFLVPRCIELKIFQEERSHLNRCPIEIKIMACLRYLGRGLTFDDIYEMSEIPVSSFSAFFHEFCDGVASKFYESIIRTPAEGSFLDRLAHYAAIGLPGTMGSLDCTRLLWNRCPRLYRNWAIGKEKFPALTFLVICDHNRQVLYISDIAYLGGMNDINIANMDPMMLSLRAGDYQNHQFWMILEDGTRILCHGTYLISDNGFFESSVIMDPPKNRYTENQVLWSEWLESMRKDIECLFGILKIRFRILMHRMMQNSIGKIRNIFITCCILHNIINMFNEAIADPLYEIDPDVDEDLFMDWDESLHPTWNDYKKTWMTVDPQGNIIKYKFISIIKK